MTRKLPLLIYIAKDFQNPFVEELQLVPHPRFSCYLKPWNVLALADPDSKSVLALESSLPTDSVEIFNMDKLKSVFWIYSELLFVQDRSSFNLYTEAATLLSELCFTWIHAIRPPTIFASQSHRQALIFATNVWDVAFISPFVQDILSVSHFFYPQSYWSCSPTLHTAVFHRKNAFNLVQRFQYIWPHFISCMS